MTLDEREIAYHKEMKERIFSQGRTELNDYTTAREIFKRHLRAAQEEAVALTARKAFKLCYGEDDYGIEFPAGEVLKTEKFFAALTPEKVLDE